jgi:signal peptidase I
MTRPGPPPSRGRHSAPDGDARPDEAAPGGRHAAPDPPRRRHAAPEQGGVAPPSGRRHAAPDGSPDGVPDGSPDGVPDWAPNGVTYHRPILGTSIRQYRPDPYSPPTGAGPDPHGYSRPGANGAAYYRPDPDPNGYPTPGPNGAGYHSPNGYPRSDPNRAGYYGPDPELDRYPTRSPNGAGYYGADPGPSGYAPPGVGRHRPEPRANGHAGADGAGYYGAAPSADGSASPGGQHRSERDLNWAGYRSEPGPDGAGHRPEPGANGYGGGHRRREPDPGGYPAPGADAIGYHRPGTNGAGRRRAAPDAGDPGADGIDYHRPGAHRYCDDEPAPYPWPEGNGYHLDEPAPYPWPGANGYHLDEPAPPVVNGYRLDEPVAPVTGFPYTAPPSTPTAYPLNGHGVDAAERDAVSWPVNGKPTAWPVDGHRTELDPQIAVVPLTDEPTEVLDRPAPKPAAGKQPTTPSHPPRAVVRRRQARRKALEWPFLIVFAVVSAFLIRQYVVQTFYIPSASMHETLIEGDRVLVNKVGYHLHDIHRGDVVVFRKPPNLDVSEDDLIKRVVALPGETVEGRGGKVYVNGDPLDEPYVEPLCHGTGGFPKVTVPAGTLWMMGDNRCNSSDSRVFGPIGQNLVVGRAFVIAWPFDRLSWL